MVGGIPLYLLEFEEQKSSIENITHHIVRKGNILYDEVNFLLKEELREPKTYFSILREISNGKHRLHEISDATGLERTSLTKYIQTLESLDIIEKYYPVTERKIKSKKVRYEIKDNYFTFWFKFIHQFRSDLERSEYTAFLHYVNQELPSFVGKRFQHVCQEFLRKNLPFAITKAGTQWGKIPGTKNTYEIDIVLLHEQTKHIAFVECKWKDLSLNQSLKILKELQEKATYVEWYKKERKEHFGLIARKIDQKERLREKGFFVYDMDDWRQY